MQPIGASGIADEVDRGRGNDCVAVTGRPALDGDFDGLPVESMVVMHDD